MKRQSGIRSKILEPSGISARGGRQASFLCGRGRSSAVRGSPDWLARKTQRTPVQRRELLAAARPRPVLRGTGGVGFCLHAIPTSRWRSLEMKNGVSKWTHGPAFNQGGIRFRLWAPGEKRVELVIDGRDDPVSMTPAANGFFETLVRGVGAGARYRFALSDGRRVPDPASRFQPEDVNGPSEAIDPSVYRWRGILGRASMGGHRVLRTPCRRFFP